MVKCILVKSKDAEKVRRELLFSNILDNQYTPKKTSGGVYFPVKEKFKNFKLFEVELKRRTPRVFSLEESLKGKLTPEETKFAVKSFDIIGDIAIIEVPKELERKEKVIADSLMEVHRNVKSVFKKTSPLFGVFRVRKLKLIAGENRTITEYRENNCRFKLDVSKVYFTPRLSFERKRIAGQVKPGERILAMFAGVGPFPIVIAKFQPKVKIVAIELNPVAFKYLEENIRLNRMQEIITPILGDVEDVIHRRFAGWADRVLMPLPKGGEKFLGEAFIAAKKDCMVHFYQFAPEKKPFEEAEKQIQINALICGRKAEVLGRRAVRTFAPGVVQIVVDFRAI